MIVVRTRLLRIGMGLGLIIGMRRVRRNGRGVRTIIGTMTKIIAFIATLFGGEYKVY